MGAVVDAAWYRSWPEAVPDDRAHVHDRLPRLVMRDHDYATVTDWPTHQPGWFLLEWDVALDRGGRDRFVEHALAEPGRVLVAPYSSPFRRPRGVSFESVHRVRRRPIAEGTATCETFGLGCVYLPQAVLDRWLDVMPTDPIGRGRFDDLAFSLWHHRTIGPAPVDWSVRPQHLHGD